MRRERTLRPLRCEQHYHQVICSITSVAAIFNLTAPSATIPCGPCAWLPSSVTATLLVTGIAVSFEYPIPCLPNLVGAQFETQWTLIDPVQAPCPLFPWLTISNWLLLTIGQ